MENVLISLLGLTALQIVLGIDNVIFLSVLTSRLDIALRNKARKIGVVISIIMNSFFIIIAGHLAAMHEPLFTLFNHGFDVHALVMIGGGLFLVFKAVKELYKRMELKENSKTVNGNLFRIILTMMLIDFVFSIDSTVTAVGMSDIRWVQITSTAIAIVVMFFFFVPLNKLTEKHPSFKLLALAFLVLIGFTLFIDGMGIEIPKGYIYSIMVFAILIEIVNIRFENKKRKAMPLYEHDEVIEIVNKALAENWKKGGIDATTWLEDYNLQKSKDGKN